MVGVPDGDGTRRILAAVVSSNYFDTIGVRLAVGISRRWRRWATPLTALRSE